ncbi:MAG: class I SAM-dependent methyltransferase [Planctomycetota bacterium]|jgi:2-polyprenyl-3-methyl-5-hydroxy-6-metoxy-1,4-benzoquinol methylase
MQTKDHATKSVTKQMDKDLKKQQEIYDKTWISSLKSGKEEHGNLQTNLDFLVETDLLKPNYKILEVGCGIGNIVFELTKKGYDITGSDISGEAIAYGHKKYGDIKLEVQPAEELQFENETFDIVLSFDLFEHIAEVDNHIREVFRVLRPGGYYMFQTPNKYSNIIFETIQTRTLKWRNYHPSLHSPGQLKRRLSRHGFNTKFVKMNPINEFTIKKFKKLGPVGNIFKHINFRRLPLILQTNLYVIAEKTKQ